MTRLRLDNDLLDEIRIWLRPALSGKATPSELVYRDEARTQLGLVDTSVHTTGKIILNYRPC